MAFALSEEHERELRDILARYPNKMAACIPVLHLCQDNNDGWVSEDVIAFVSGKLDLSPAHVKGVVTFYSLFNEERPGKHQVWVCRTLSCALRGSGDILHHCEKRLGVHVGGTTKDGKITLRTAECLAACGTAPVMQVDKTYHENLSVESVDKVLDRLLAEG
ncbi:MAG TPA: NAD(P)H-dependent oxidoreductase subunit E [Polyangiaceae bacterium]|jgi:NADH-quinone oxidoreductase subunit E|nr:NAD(P)H-dependent oxidoreductase subunit E [Polyangiaceae bacterium]